MNVTISLAEIVSILTLIISVIGVLGTIIWNLWKKVVENAKNLDEFKLQVAKDYASYKHISELNNKMMQTEQNLITSINNLTSRIDRILNRFDKGMRDER